MSPFNPEKTAIQTGRLMLERINNLIRSGQDFGFETTLATKSYKNFIEKAKQNDYKVTLLFFWLRTPNLAVKRVETRVKEGGHNIPEDVIRRRYDNGLINFFNIFKDIVDEWILIDNSGEPYEIIAEGNLTEIEIRNKSTWENLNKVYNK